MNWLTKAVSALTGMFHAGRPSFFSGLLRRSKFDYRREVGDCLDASVVTAPVLWVARALPEATLEVSRVDKAGKRTEFPDHPMLALIQNPNAFYGDIALWMATLISFLIAGNAYWLIVRNGARRPAELWYVPHWLVEPRWPIDGSAFISHYRYSPGGGVEPMDIPYDDVVHFRHGIDPRNVRLGLSPLDGVIREIFVDLESSNFVASLLRNMGVPGVVISPKGGAMPAPEDVEATKAWFGQAFGGDNRGKPLVMGAPTEVQSFGFNPQQLNMSEGRDVAEERVCACLGIPAAIVGFGAGLQQTKVGATMEELRKLAWNNGVLPFARMLADEVQRSLVGQFGNADGQKVGWDTCNVNALQEDEDKRVERLNKQLNSGGITLYEYRIALGFEADDSHKFYLRPINMIAVPAGAPVAVAAPAPVAALPAPKEHATIAELVLESVAKGLASHGIKDNRRASDAAYQRGEAFVRMLTAQSGGLEKAFEPPLVTLFAKMAEQVRAVAMPLLEEDAAYRQVPKGKDRRAKADDLLAQMILDKLGIPEWQGELQTDYEAQYLEVAKAVQDASERAGLGTSLPDVVARSIVAAGGKRASMVDLGDQTKAALFEALAQGRAAGEGANQLATRIADKVQAGPWSDPKIRAQVIARTETKFAQNISTIERARAAGVTSMIVFDGRFGFPRSTPSHIARNGSIVPIAEASVMADEEHPNGTLSFAPNFEEDN